MPDGDRYPQFIAQKFKKAVDALVSAPQIVGQSVAATVIKDFKRDVQALTPALERVFADYERLLSLPLEQRQTQQLNLDDICKNRSEKLLARAALKVWSLQFVDAQGVSPVEVRQAITSEYLHQQIQASFISPVQFRVQQGTLQVDKNFESILTTAQKEAKHLTSKAIKGWVLSGDRQQIEQISVPQRTKLGTAKMLEGGSHEVEFKTSEVKK
jgi:hypothetical protein